RAADAARRSRTHAPPGRSRARAGDEGIPDRRQPPPLAGAVRRRRCRPRGGRQPRETGAGQAGTRAVMARGRMRIAQLAPPDVPVPPGRYGGTERVIYDLTEALVSRGHDVTLFASGDSRTSARLVPTVPRALWDESGPTDSVATLFRVHAQAFGRAADFDLVHAHAGYFAFPYARQSPAPIVATLHGRLDVPELRTIFGLFPEVGLV